MKGTYVLLIELDHDEKIQIGKLGLINFKSGFYVYVGSALNNLEKRVKRHLSSEKKIHWHIDYFLQNGIICDVFYKECSSRYECIIANEFKKHLTFIKDFGCSDCNCISHFFYGKREDIFKIIIKNKLDKLSL